MSRPAAPLALALLLAAPAVAPAAGGTAGAQTSLTCPVRRGTHIAVNESNGRRTLLIADGGRCFEARSVGEVELTDDDGDVRRLAPGGSLAVQETRGGVTRRAEYAERGGAVERRYWEDGRAVGATEGAAWARGLLAQVARESMIGADARARRLVRAGGVRAVLDEVAQVGSDGVKRVYLTTLLAERRLTDDELAAVARAAGRSLASDSDKGVVLRAVLAAGGAPAAARAVVDAARGIASDSEKGRVLAAAAAAPGADAAVRAAVVDAAATIASDRTKADLLASLGAAGGAGPYLGAARTIASDAERRRVLLAALEPRRDGDALLAAAPARDAFFAVADGIASDRERGTVLRALAARDALPRPALLALLRSAGRIASDRERADVLLAVSARPEAMRDAEVRRAFLDVTRTLASSSEYRRVMDAVVR